MKRRPFIRRRTDASRLHVHRSPGPFGIFIRDATDGHMWSRESETWEWPGLPANDNKPRVQPTIFYEDY